MLPLAYDRQQNPSGPHRSSWHPRLPTADGGSHASKCYSYSALFDRVQASSNPLTVCSTSGPRKPPNEECVAVQQIVSIARRKIQNRLRMSFVSG